MFIMEYITPEKQKMYAEIQRTFMIIAFIAISSIPAIMYRRNMKKRSEKTLAFAKQAKEIDAIWDIDKIKERITSIFYMMPNIVNERNITKMSTFASEHLLNQYRMNFEWQIARKENEVVKNIDLYYIDLIQLHETKNNRNDYAWFHIQGERILYTLDENGIIVSGEKKSKEFKEYWKMIRIDNTFYVDSIKNEVEIDIDELNNYIEKN